MASFERFTDNTARLVRAGWARRDFYLRKRISKARELVFLPQRSLPRYCETHFKVKLFRKPDEAYLIHHGNSRYTLKVLEKKSQKVGGSVDTKLCADQWFREEYQELLGPNFKIEYALCLSKWLQDQYQSDKGKWPVMRKLHARHGTRVFFGEDPDYFKQIDEWVTGNDSGVRSCVEKTAKALGHPSPGTQASFCQ